MAIYVDESKYPFRGQLYCHMMTDGESVELRAFGARIGLRSGWIQREGEPYEHFDLSPLLRKKAVDAGAVEVDAQTLIKKCVQPKRIRLMLPNPNERPQNIGGIVKPSDS